MSPFRQATAAAGRGETVPAAGAPLARLVAAACGHARQAVVRDVTLDVPRGAVTAFIGGNGSGKTTVLRTLLGLLAPLSGTVSCTPRTGYAPQVDLSEAGFPVTAGEVVAMGLLPTRPWWARPAPDARARVTAALEQLELGALIDRPFRALSGGQRQRTLLARGLVAGPELLVLDEPVRGLDVAASSALVALLVRLAHESGLGVLVATHSLDLVANHADQVALFRDGRVESGPAHALMTDAVLSRFVGRPMLVREVAGQRVVLADLSATPRT